MRLMLTTLAATLLLAACASTPAPAPQAEKLAAAKKSPQCYSGDTDRFFSIGEKTTIAGVAVGCTATADGKSASWTGGAQGK